MVYPSPRQEELISGIFPRPPSYLPALVSFHASLLYPYSGSCSLLRLGNMLRSYIPTAPPSTLLASVCLQIQVTIDLSTSPRSSEPRPPPLQLDQTIKSAAVKLNSSISSYFIFQEKAPQNGLKIMNLILIEHLPRFQTFSQVLGKEL